MSRETTKRVGKRGKDLKVIGFESGKFSASSEVDAKANLKSDNIIIEPTEILNSIRYKNWNFF